MPPASVRPRTPEQNRVYHGKVNSLAAAAKIDFLEAKRRALQLASAIVGRQLESSTELSEIEMERVLEALDDHLAELGFVREPKVHA